MKRTICKSGQNGWTARLHKVYANFDEFVHYDSLYGIAYRLGYSSVNMAWLKNPLIKGSVIPSDLEKVA